MRLHSLKKAISLSLLSFSVFGLMSCGETNLPPVDPLEPKDALEVLEEAYLAKNYTLDIQDDSGNFVQYFMSDFYAYKFESSTSYTCYKEDSTGIYKITATDEKVTDVGYYDVDSSTGEPTKGLYENVTYSLNDLTLLPSLYREINGGYYLRDTEGDEAKVWFYLCGFMDDGSVDNVTLSLVEEMGFYLNDNTGNIEFTMVFDSSLEKEDTIITIKNVGTTAEPKPVKKYLDEGGKGKTYLDSSDMLYTYLGYLRNMYNYTLKVESHYTGDNEGRNYKVVSKFTNKAYHSVSSRSNEEDLGYVLDEGVVKTLLIDGATGNGVIGDTVLDDDGNTYKSITSVVNSLKDLSWNDLVFEAYKNDEKDYTIENKSFIAAIACLLDDTFFRFQIPSLRFQVFGEGSEQTYRFTANLYDGDNITLDIVDINSTVIGNL